MNLDNLYELELIDKHLRKKQDEETKEIDNLFKEIDEKNKSTPIDYIKVESHGKTCKNCSHGKDHHTVTKLYINSALNLKQTNLGCLKCECIGFYSLNKPQLNNISETLRNKENRLKELKEQKIYEIEEIECQLKNIQNLKEQIFEVEK